MKDVVCLDLLDLRARLELLEDLDALDLPDSLETPDVPHRSLVWP